MDNYSDEIEEDFENFSDDDYDDGNNSILLEVSINTNKKSTNGYQKAYDLNVNGHNSDDDLDSLIDGSHVESDELELHGRGNRMKLSNKPPEILLRQYQKKITTCLRQGQAGQAIEDLIRCTALARIVFGDCHWKFAESEAELAKAYWKYKGMAPQGQQHAEEARNIMLRVVQAGGAQEDRKHIYRTLLSVYVTLGESFNAQQKFTDAELSYQKAEKILSEQSKTQKKSVSADDQEQDQELKSELRIAQGKLTANQGKSASAIAYFEEAISIIQSEYGDDSIKLIPLYQMVGKVEQSRDGANHIKSIEAYLQAHSIANANEGTEELAETGYQLALAYTRAAVEDKDAETSAESYLNECIGSYQSLHGPNHEKTLRCQDELARLMIRTDRPEEAVGLLKSTLPAKRATFGEHSQSLASTYKLLGSVHMSQGNMERALSSMNKELSEAEQQYRSLQQQHLGQLQAALEDKDRQLKDGKALFEQLKQDFKYNLRLLQERDDELEQNDMNVVQLRQQLDHQLTKVSEVSVRLHEANERCGQLEEEHASRESSYKKQLQAERANSDRKMSEKVKEHSKQRLEWESEKRALEENLKISEEIRICEKREAQQLFEEQLNHGENDWRIRVQYLESEALAQQLKVASLTTETENLRADRSLQTQVVEGSEATQQRLENDLKQSRWELEDYRAMCTRRIQDLESQIAFSQQTQKGLVEKYERKVVQAEARLQETIERQEKTTSGYNNKVNSCNHQIQQLMGKLSDNETELARQQWRLDDLDAEKTKLIETNALEKAKLMEQVKALEEKDNSRMLQEEIDHLKKCIADTRENLKTKTSDVENYQMKLAAAADELSEAERQRARLELDCQKKCEDIQRHHYEKSENLISRLSQAKDRSEATVKRMEKESRLHQQAISELKKDRKDAYDTLTSHGINIQFSQVAEKTCKLGDEDIRLLKVQNENLKEVIAQMRRDMEKVALPIKGPAHDTRRAESSIYVNSLEDEIKHLKEQLRAKERGELKLEPSSSELAKVVLSHGDAAAKQIVTSLNASIASLRSEKVELLTASRKQQVEIEHLRSQLHQIKNNPRNVQIELEQAKYELNVVSRRLDTEVSSLKQRIAELETQIESTREEAAEYHRCLLAANADNQLLSTELSNLKMSEARSGNIINYGAQELIIQNLQDENERLRNMIKDKGINQNDGGELQKALSRISQLNKEKIILTELSNRLRSELLKAGIDIKKPPKSSQPPHPDVQKGLSSESRVAQAVQGKLEQLENLQYKLTKADISRTTNNLSKHSPTDNTKTIPSVSPPTRQQRKVLSHHKAKTVELTLPVFMEQDSSSGSSFVAKGKPTVMQPSKGNQSRKYVAPLPKTKPKSNVAWVKKPKSSYKEEQHGANHIDVSSNTAVADENSITRLPEQDSAMHAASGVLDSIDLGSSIQEVWKILDDHPSLNSTTPD